MTMGENVATDLKASIWNAIADLVNRSQSPREVYFSKVTRADDILNIVWVEDFGTRSIPLVGFTQTIEYYDTVPDNADLGTGVVAKHQEKRSDPENPVFATKYKCPRKGDVVIILDPWGAKRFPICIGVIQSRAGFWEG
jgi:hypothetical protein